MTELRTARRFPDAVSSAHGSRAKNFPRVRRTALPVRRRAGNSEEQHTPGGRWRTFRAQPAKTEFDWAGSAPARSTSLCLLCSCAFPLNSYLYFRLQRVKRSWRLDINIQVFAQLDDRAVNRFLGGAARATHRFGYLVVSHLFMMPEQKDQSLLRS